MGRNCLLERLDGALVTFALGVDVSEEARDVLKDTNNKIYHLHFIRRLD